MRKTGALTLALAGVLLAAGTASAAPIVGQINLSGDGVIRIYAPGGAGNPSVSPATNGYIDFAPLNPLTPGFGTATVVGSSGYFLGLNGQTDLIKDLDQALYPTGPAGFPGGPLDMFETIGASLIDFHLSNINRCGDIGSGTCDAGVNSPFNFAYDSSTGLTTILISMKGFVTRGVDIGNWVGRFSATLAGTPTAILLQLDAAGHVDASWEGFKISSEVPPIPEPTTMLLLGTGSAIAAYRRRRANKA
jgi:hypothetical protein